MPLPHGAIIYDWNGQNFCLNNCITSDMNPDRIRQLIYHPNGDIAYDWKHEAAVIL